MERAGMGKRGDAGPSSDGKWSVSDPAENVGLEWVITSKWVVGGGSLLGSN